MEPHNLQELDEKGFTVVRNVVPKELTTKARDLMDAIIGGPPPAAGVLGLEKCPTGPIDDPEARGQPGPWPEPGDPRPVIASGGYTHSLHHPIPDENYGHPGLMAALLEHYVEVNKQLLRCSDEDAKGLKLMQQFFRRTDLGPKPRNGCTSDGEPPRGWHMDQAFLPHHVSAAAPFHLRSLKGSRCSTTSSRAKCSTTRSWLCTTLARTVRRSSALATPSAKRWRSRARCRSPTRRRWCRRPT